MNHEVNEEEDDYDSTEDYVCMMAERILLIVWAVLTAIIGIVIFCHRYL